jgi:hypothetical protein
MVNSEVLADGAAQMQGDASISIATVDAMALGECSRVGAVVPEIEFATSARLVCRRLHQVDVWIQGPVDTPANGFLHVLASGFAERIVVG